MRSFLITLLLFSTLLGKDTLHFVVPSFKPFTYREEETFQGIGIERVRSIFETLRIPITITLVPNYGRAVEETRSGRYDGFFAASQNEERDNVAHFCAPLFYNRWSWFHLQESTLKPQTPEFLEKARIATHVNTNTHKWLKANDFSVAYATNLSSLVPLLIKKKVDAIFLAEEVFNGLLEEADIAPYTIIQTIESTRPMGLYLSKRVDQRIVDRVKKEITVTFGVIEK